MRKNQPQGEYVEKSEMKQKPESFFIDRIGKIIYRDQVLCPCLVCREVTEIGVFIHDKQHANYLYLCQNEMDIEYRDEK